MKNDLRGLNFAEMEALVLDLSQPKFRAKQLFTWVHEKSVGEISQMHNMGGKFLEALGVEWQVGRLQLTKRQVSVDGTEKYLFTLSDGQAIETVLMRYRGDKSKQRNTLCISSQVGCAMGCTFCATGQGGLVRNLSVGEIVGQIYEVNAILLSEQDDFKIGNVVFMGMGEPLLNYNHVLKAIDLLNDDQGQNIGIRRIALSTCGIVPKIDRLAESGLDLVLAVSLHAPNDRLRSQVMPINKQYPLAKLMEACHNYQRITKNRITFEYALIKGFNDQAASVGELARLLKELDCHVNVIPVNPVKRGEEFTKPQKNEVTAFLNQLKKANVNASTREEKGSDIDGACGQLRGNQG